MFVVTAIAILEGERDYSEQTLATLKLQRSHFLRGVATIVAVSVKMECVKNVCFYRKPEKPFMPSQETHLRTTDNTQILYFVVL